MSAERSTFINLVMIEWNKDCTRVCEQKIDLRCFILSDAESHEKSDALTFSFLRRHFGPQMAPWKNAQKWPFFLPPLGTPQTSWVINNYCILKFNPWRTISFFCFLIHGHVGARNVWLKICVMVPWKFSFFLPHSAYAQGITKKWYSSDAEFNKKFD